jgi:broad specificity phosphatase PhoE
MDELSSEGLSVCGVFSAREVTRVTRLLFIRHGQASFGSANYDVLSSTGVAQSRHLGTYLAQIERPLSAIVSGAMERQRDTARHLRESATTTGLVLPSPTVDVGLNEYPAFEILDHAIATLPDDPDVRDFLALDDEGTPKDTLRRKERAIHALICRWAEGTLDVGELETFVAFEVRVNAAIDRILEDALRARDDTNPLVGVVTSGGPVAIAMKRALLLSPRATLDLAWTILNASFTELFVRRDVLHVHRFNAVPHLEPARLLTFR